MKYENIKKMGIAMIFIGLLMIIGGTEFVIRAAVTPFAAVMGDNPQAFLATHVSTPTQIYVSIFVAIIGVGIFILGIIDANKKQP